VSGSDIAAIACVNLAEPFILSIPADGKPFPQIIDHDQVGDQELDESDLDRDSENRNEGLDTNGLDPSNPAVGDH
jgi:hypothetical protein